MTPGSPGAAEATDAIYEIPEKGLGLGLKDLGFRVGGLGFRVEGLGFRV